jgi:DNA-binding transcriptional regulator GbsR (MarR family)
MARRRAISLPALDDAQTRFIAAWGQMGSTWGISRTMAEIHALLFISGSPLNTDQIMQRLSISRGNASMSLRALQEWGIVSRVHKRGDRKEYFEAEQDAWSMLRKVIRERLRREVHPVLASLFDIRDSTQLPASEARAPSSSPLAAAVAEHNRRLDSLLELVQTIDRLGERFVGSDGKGLRAAAMLLSKVS